MDSSELEKGMNALIARLDDIVTSLKAIRNYQYDNMCVDFLRSVRRGRADVFLQWERLLGDPAAFAAFDLAAYTAAQTKMIDGFLSTLEYLKARPPIRKPY